MSQITNFLKKNKIFLLFCIMGILTLYPFLLTISSSFNYLDWQTYETFNFIKYIFSLWKTNAIFNPAPLYIFVYYLSSLTSGYSNTLYFLLLFTLGGFWFYKNYEENDKLGLAALYGILLVFNPFVYERIMMGQWGVVASTVLLPIFLYYMFKYFKEPTNHNLIQLVIGFMVSSIHQIHFFVINLGLLILYFLLRQCSLLTELKQDKEKLKSEVTTFGKVLLILFIVNLYWIIPYIYIKLSGSQNIIDTIDYSHLQFFTSRPSSGDNTLFLNSAMYGSWREKSMILAKDHLPDYVFIMIFFVFIYLMVRGFLTDPENLENRFLIIMWIVGLLLATGISHPWTKNFFVWLFENIHLFSGFRDSNKFVALVVVSYAILGAKGLKDVLDDKKNKVKGIILTLVLAMIIVYNYPQIGLHNQLHPISYPKCYSNLNAYLNTLPEDAKIIYLPWHIYITYNWSIPAGIDGRISNPINRVVDRYIITGAHPTDFGILTGEAVEIDECIKTESVDCLREKHVNYVIFDKTAMIPMRQVYGWITNQTISYEDECVIVYLLN